MMKVILVGLFTLLVTASASFADGYKEGDDGEHFLYPGHKDFFRLDCRYHNIEKNPGVNFCYASAIYQEVGNKLVNIHLGVGCDNQTIFYDKARLHIETTLDRLSPKKAATPGVEVFPQGQLTTTGTYTSMLDISLGRFQGLCYVHKVGY